MLEQELSLAGMRIVNNSKKADFIAYFGYAIDQGKLVTTNYSIPQWGVTGYSGENLHWILHALTAWIIGDLIASIVIKIFVR